jgi:hypothetical protein
MLKDMNIDRSHFGEFTSRFQNVPYSDNRCVY